jgi:hypothetical protein
MICWRSAGSSNIQSTQIIDIEDLFFSVPLAFLNLIYFSPRLSVGKGARGPLFISVRTLDNYEHSYPSVHPRSISWFVHLSLMRL